MVTANCNLWALELAVGRKMMYQMYIAVYHFAISMVMYTLPFVLERLRISTQCHVYYSKTCPLNAVDANFNVMSKNLACNEKLCSSNKLNKP